MLQVGAQDESKSSWAIRQQLLLAQAVHQVQADGSAEKSIDWTKVTEILEQFLKSRKIERLDFSFNDQTVCSDLYAKLCQTFLDDQSQDSLDGSQTLKITRQLYGVYIQSIAQALQEEEKKCERIRSEIDAITRGEWDEKLKGSVSDYDDDDDDDDATVEQLIKAGQASSPETTKKSKNPKNEREQPDPSDSKKDSSDLNMPQSKRARLPEKEDDLSQRDAEISGKSPASGHSPSHKREGAVMQEKRGQGRRETTSSPTSNKLPTASEALTDADIRGGKMTDESHSTTDSPTSTKKSSFDHEVSADGSLVGTPNSATFGISTTEGNLTANQTPNSAKLGLYPTTITDTSSTASAKVAGSSSINNTGTTNDPTSFRRRMLKTHSSVQSNPISSIFRDPVKESEAPGYYSIIKRPMDLRTLAKKLRDGKVISTEEYRRDLMLMLANAVMFNHEDSEVAKNAKELMVECDRLVSFFWFPLLIPSILVQKNNPPTLIGIWTTSMGN